MTWHSIWFDIFNICGSVWLNGVGKNRQTNEEHDKYCAEDRFQLARVKFDRDGKVVKLQVCGIVASIFEMDWNKN